MRRLTPPLIIALLLSSLPTSIRASAETVLPSPYWRDTITFPSDSFRAAGAQFGSPGWIKFLIFTSDPSRVYFQHSVHYPFHYDFAAALVSEYIGMTAEEFDQITLYATGQQAILGSVLLPYWSLNQPPAEQIQEYGIQFVRQDSYDRAQVVTLFNLVKSKVTAGDGVEAFYFPSYEQAASAEENRSFFESNGIIVSSTSRWAKGNVSYSRGWALGTLKQVPSAQINEAYLLGDLRPDDILLTDGIPAELPVLAGIITLAPATPSSHVAILANTYGIPFTHLALAPDAARAQQLVGRKVVLRVYGPANDCDARLIDVQEVITPEQTAEILQLKVPPPLNISPVTTYGAYTASTEGLWPSDIRYFGGKAANFGLLRRSIPADCPVAMAISFDLWNAFLGQTVSTGRILSREIAYRLAGVTWPPADMAALSATLNDIRENLFKSNSATAFTPALQSAILAALQDPQYGFDPLRKIRFRSSTNVEDSEQFTGAGLYDSFSGCLADDHDADTVGPSHCDASESSERGVFRAIRRVFASFYNDNAYIERLRHGVPENQVGMGILVHHSTPDPIELANGVAILNRTGTTTRITLTTQEGAVSVTNPEGGAIPEEVDVSVYSFGTYLTLRTYSSLVPLGAKVLEWESEYRALAAMLVQASNAFASASGKTSYVLDFEYKKVAPEGKLRVKQIRELPQQSTTPSITPFLVNEPTEYATFQGEYADVFANHRLKSQWTISTRSMWLTPENLAQSIYTDGTLTYVDSEGSIRTQAGASADWAEPSHAYAPTVAQDGWTIADMGNPRRYTLRTAGVGGLVSPAQCPILTIRDLGSPSYPAFTLELQVAHDRAVPAWTWSGPIWTSQESVRLMVQRGVEAGEHLQTRTLAGPKGVVVRTQFYWPPPPGAAAGYTAPLARWVQTQITGYTAQPIVLHGFFSQTYRPEHHNFGEHFLFEPQLEPGIDPAILAELRTRNIRMLHVNRTSSGTCTFTTYGYTAPVDFDNDRDVDETDFATFLGCVTGPTVGPPDWGCRSSDLDHDGDVDQDDFGIFQRCYTGPGRIADPDCTR